MNSLNRLQEYTGNLKHKSKETYQVAFDLLSVFHEILSDLQGGETFKPTITEKPAETNISQDLKKMNRVELLELLLDVTKVNHQLQEEVEVLQAENELLQKKLESRMIAINQAGTIAEAAFQLNGVYEATQEAAKQYLENLALLYEREKKQAEGKHQTGDYYVSQLLTEAEEKCAEMKELIHLISGIHENY